MGRPKKKSTTKGLARDDVTKKVMDAFARCNSDVRTYLINTLPAYNILLSIDATSFNDFALQRLNKESPNPKEQWRYYKVECKNCHRSDNMRHIGGTHYRCEYCKTETATNANSMTTNTHKDALTWMKVMHCLLNCYGVSRTCRACEIRAETYYAIVCKLFYAMRLMLDDIRLYGLIECDNTFVRVSYKGSSLEVPEYEESNEDAFMMYTPRSSRNRGGSYTNATRNDNSICIFTAIDNHGHCVVKYVDIGSASAVKLHKAVSKERYLFKVPEKDPFEFTKATGKKKTVNKRDTEKKKAGDETLLVSDNEAAIKKYAEEMGMPHEHHVYWIKGKPARLKKDDHDIQRVNALHRRLKNFLRKLNYVSSKYLPGYLTLFEFIENTGATPDAIHKVFEILVKPGQISKQSFYEEKFTVPTVYFEYAKDHPALKKYSYNQIKATYMYHKMITDKAAGKVSDITMPLILDQTGYSSAKVVRNIYGYMTDAGLIDEACLAAESRTRVTKNKQDAMDQKNYQIALEYYDAFCEYFLTDKEKRIGTQQDIFNRLNAKHGLKYKHNALDYYRRQIEAAGIRPYKLSELRERDKRAKVPKKVHSKKAYQALEMYEELMSKSYIPGQLTSARERALEIIGEQLNLAPTTVANYIDHAKYDRKTLHNKEEKNEF